MADYGDIDREAFDRVCVPEDEYEALRRERDEARAEAAKWHQAWVNSANRYEAAAGRLREALSLISQHAHADERERGFGEASRYYAIADDALAPAATGERS
jgi:hypothetical protein